MGIRLKGIVAAPVTPFTADNRVDRAMLAKQINFLVESGVHLIALPMHIGESLNLSIDERKELTEVAVEAAGGRVPIIVNVSLSGTDQVIDLARHSQRSGADAVIITAPYYWPSTQAALLDHFLTIGAAIDLPFLCYNNLAVGPALSVELIAQMTERTDQFVGLKDASSNMEYFSEVCRVTSALRPTFAAFLGVEYLLPGMALGAVGSFSACGEIAPRLVRDLYAACARGDTAAARPLQYRASRLWHILKVGYPAPIKAAMELMGRPVGATRKPIPPLSEEAKLQLREELRSLEILDQEPHGW